MLDHVTFAKLCLAKKRIGTGSTWFKKASNPVGRAYAVKIRGRGFCCDQSVALRICMRMATDAVTSKQSRALCLRIVSEQHDRPLLSDRFSLCQLQSSLGNRFEFGFVSQVASVLPVLKIGQGCQPAPATGTGGNHEDSTHGTDPWRSESIEKRYRHEPEQECGGDDHRGNKFRVA